MERDPQGPQGVCTRVGGAKVPSITFTACLGLGAGQEDGLRAVSRRRGVCVWGGAVQEPLGLLPSAGLPWKENSRSKTVCVKCHSEGRGASSLLGQPCPEPLSLTHLHTPGPLTCPNRCQAHRTLRLFPEAPITQGVTGCLGVLPLRAPSRPPPAGTFGNPVDSCGPSRCKRNQ